MKRGRSPESRRSRNSSRPNAWQRLAAAALPITTAAFVLGSSGCANSDQGPPPTGAYVEQSDGQTFLDFCFARPRALGSIIGIDMQEQDGYWAGESHLNVSPALMPEQHGQLSSIDEQATSIQSLFAQLASGRLLIIRTGHIPGTSFLCHRPTTFEYSTAGYIGNLVAADYSAGAPVQLESVDGPIGRLFNNDQEEDFSPIGVTN